MYPITEACPGMQKEFIPFVEHIANQIGIVWRNDKKEGLPIRVLVKTDAQLPYIIQLPEWNGGVLEQKVQFIGLQDQCFYCKQIGHYIQDRQKHKGNRGKAKESEVD
ncbi:hypothetical protein KP509_37G053700 [Ceratopteris richardii]|uniref:Uncharacterized protein n=1 Tax=Ceratopteris richardii TaxID=49495 RepID=A0A8T2Q9C9_CERRI|nr:hypothetical protein KP509_37G053700 [Ceratopteris richardii]